MSQEVPPESGRSSNNGDGQRVASIEAAASLGILASLGSVFAAIVRSKVTASALGPMGVGMAAEIQQMANLALAPLVALTGPVLVHSFARERESKAGPVAVSSAVSWVFVIGCLFGVAAVFAASLVFPREEASVLLVAVACLGLLVGALGSIGTAVLTFEGQLKITTKIQLSSAFLSVVLVTSFTVLFGLTGQFVAAVAVPVLLMPWVFRAVRELPEWPRGGLRASFDLAFFRDALKFGVAALIAAVSLQGALSVIRWRLEVRGGPELNGQFQASWAIGSAYLGMVLSAIGGFAFPRYAAAPNGVVLQREVDSTAQFVVRVSPPLVLLAVGFADVGVRLLYSDHFETAIRILRWQLAGDVAKCLSWAYAGPLLYRGRIRAFIITELTAAALLAIAAWVLIELHGSEGVGQAYLITYLAYLPLAAAVTSLSLGVTARLRHLVVVVSSTVAMAMLAAVEINIYARVAISVVVCIWLWCAGLLSLVFRKIRASIS